MRMWTTGKVIERIDWNNKLFSLKISADIQPFIAGQFIKLSQVRDGKRIARAYSLVNSPETDYIEILAVSVEGGQLSPELHTLQVGSEIQVSTQAAGFMILDELPRTHSAQTLWLLATGTAIGPFLSMLETEEAWKRFKRIVFSLWSA